MLCLLGITHWWDNSLTPLLLGPTAVSTTTLYKKRGNKELGRCLLVSGDTAGGRKKLPELLEGVTWEEYI